MYSPALRHLVLTALAGASFFIALPAQALTGEQVAKLVANDGAEDDFFGYSVSVSGDT